MSLNLQKSKFYRAGKRKKGIKLINNIIDKIIKKYLHFLYVYLYSIRSIFYINNY